MTQFPLKALVLTLATGLLSVLAQAEETDVPSETVLIPEDTFEAIGFILVNVSGLAELELSESELSAVIASFTAAMNGQEPNEAEEALMADASQYMATRYQAIQAGEDYTEATQDMLSAMGKILSQQSRLQDLELNSQEVAKIAAGMREGADVEGVPSNLAETNRRISNFFQTRSLEVQQSASQRNLAAGQAFLAAMAEEAGVQRDPAGFYYKILEAGTDPKATMADSVNVHYTGTLIDGTVFDSSRERGEPVTFPMSGVVPGFSGGLTHIGAGGRVMIYIPADLAYGSQSRPGSPIPANSTLVFDVELIEINPE